MAYTFGEKPTEYSQKHGGEIPVWQSPKYKAAKEKAIEIIESKKYGLTEADFWILMNTTKSGKMMYSGLIISHNGCLKINDNLPSKFDADSVTKEENGYNNSLVYTYRNKEQGIYEVGEVSNTNCKNDYPYAMALKRLFDRVVLKLSKLAYNGIYSDSESEEFTQQYNAPTESPQKPAELTFDEVEQLVLLAKKKGIKSPQATISRNYGVKSLSELTKKQYNDCKKGLETMQDVKGD